MGGVRFRDMLLDEDGNPCKVIAESRVFPDHECYEVIFDCGERIVADSDHYWLTWTAEEREGEHRKNGAIRTTLELANTLDQEHGIPAAGYPSLLHRMAFPRFHRIVACRRVASVPTKCIAVDSPSRLYLAGRAMIPTHNTDLILGLAITRHQRSVIFRRESTQLRAIIDRAREILGDTGRFNENTGVWRDLPGGRQIEMAGCKDPGDEQKHRGRPHDLACFDECDQLSEYTVRFLLGWLRTTTPGQRCRAVLTFNPPSNAEGRWLLRFFAPWVDPTFPRPAKPGELRWYVTLPNGKEIEVPDGTPIHEGKETIVPRSRTFIPSRVTDNPYLVGTGYVATLQSLPEPLRSQLLYGDMAAGLEDDPWQIIPTEWVRLAQARWTPERPAGVPLSCLGVDVARGGADQTVLSRRYEKWFAPLEKHPGRSTPDGPAVAGLVAVAIAENVSVPVHIDVIGVGASVYDLCRQQHQWAGVRAINAASGTDRRDKSGALSFANLRSFGYWYLREALDPIHGDQIALPPDPALLADLCAPRWEMRISGVQAESKDALVKRLGRSPDCGDALILAALPIASWECPTMAAAPPVVPDEPFRWGGGVQEKPRRRLFG